VTGPSNEGLLTRLSPSVCVVLRLTSYFLSYYRPLSKKGAEWLKWSWDLPPFRHFSTTKCRWPSEEASRWEVLVLCRWSTDLRRSCTVVITAKSETNLSVNLVPREKVMGNFNTLVVLPAIQGERLLWLMTAITAFRCLIEMVSSCLSLDQKEREMVCLINLVA